jgi:hypothetical protein
MTEVPIFPFRSKNNFAGRECHKRASFFLNSSKLYIFIKTCVVNRTRVKEPEKVFEHLLNRALSYQMHQLFIFAPRKILVAEGMQQKGIINS